MKPPHSKRLKVEGVLLLVLLVGIDGLLVFLCGWSIRDGLLSRESRSWPAVPGVVVSARLARSTAARGATTCSPDVRYLYVVTGVRYTGWRVAFRGGYGCGEASEILDRYRSMPDVTVRYRPSDAGTSVLEPGRWDGPVWLGLYIPITLVLMFFTVVLAIFVRTTMRTTPRR